MIIASISVAHAAYIGIVIASGEGLEFDLIACESFEVGHLEHLPERSEDGKTKRRVITDEEYKAAATRVQAVLIAYNVQKVILESPSVKSPLGSEVFTTIYDCVVDGLGLELMGAKAAEPVFSAWRYRFGRGYEYRPAARVLASKLFGSAVSRFEFDSTLFAGALMAHVILIDVDPPLTMTERRRLEREAHRQRIAEQLANSEQSAPELAELLEASIAATAPPVVVDPYEGQPIIAGLDAGTKYTGICIGQGSATPVKFLHFDTFEMEREVPLKKPRKAEVNGRIETITTKRVCSMDSVRDVAEQIMQTLLAYKVSRLIVEYTEHVHIDPEQATGRIASSIATNLVHMNWLIVMVSERARAAGIIVELVQPATWRAKVAGRIAGKKGGEGVARSGGNEYSLLRRAISTGFAGWPEGVLRGQYRVGDGNDHERDAGGLVLFGVVLLQPDEEPRARQRAAGKAGATKPPRKVKPVELAAREAEAKRRAAAGCTCTPGKRHRRECSLYKGASNALLQYQP